MCPRLPQSDHEQPADTALSFDDPRWPQLRAGYRVPVDLRPALRALESGSELEAAWDGLWQELYHQGDIGEGSFAAVPHLVRMYRSRASGHWNTYALAATIELARNRNGNPDVPDWLGHGYFAALRELASIGARQLPMCSDKETLRAILGLVAVVQGARVYGRVLVEFTEDEVQELERAAFGTSDEQAG